MKGSDLHCVTGSHMFNILNTNWSKSFLLIKDKHFFFKFDKSKDDACLLYIDDSNSTRHHPWIQSERIQQQMATSYNQFLRMKQRFQNEGKLQDGKCPLCIKNVYIV